MNKININRAEYIRLVSEKLNLAEQRSDGVCLLEKKVQSNLKIQLNFWFIVFFG